MKDKKLDKLLDDWAAQETAAAPEIRPTAEMYRMVQAKKQGRPTRFARWRWTRVAAVVAALVALAMVYTVSLHPTLFPEPTPGRPIAHIGQREGFFPEQDLIIREPTPSRGEKGPPKGAISFTQLAFQFQKPGSRIVESFDLRVSAAWPISLTAADNYRLQLEPDQACHIYVFQLTASGALVQLFPDQADAVPQNPLRQGQKRYLPSESTWFYLDENKGQESLYLIAATQPLPEIQELYDRYAQTEQETERQQALDSLLQKLDAIAQTDSETTQGWVLVFDHR